MDLVRREEINDPEKSINRKIRLDEYARTEEESVTQ